MPVCSARAKGNPVDLQLPAELAHRVRAGDAFRRSSSTVKGERDRRRQNLSLIFKSAGAPTLTTPMQPGAAAPVLDQPHHCARLPAVWFAGASCTTARPAAAVPDSQAPAHQPDVSRHLSHRHAGRRPAAQDHQPHLPVHRPQRLDRALRAGRRPRRLRSGARAFSHAQRDRGGRGRRGGQDHRRCGDGDVPDAGPRACRGVAHARRDAAR